MLDKFQSLLKGSFIKNVAVLMSGTAIAQGLAFAASPILSRLYDPAAFGIFGLFTAFCAIFSVVASAKYELAILLPKNDRDAANILWLSIGIILTVSLIAFFVVLFFKEIIAEILGSSELAPLLWWAPVTILCSGLYNAFNYWTTRRKLFKRLSNSKVIKTIGREGTQLGLGFSTGLQGGGLVFGQVAGEALSAGALITQTYKEDYGLIKKSFNPIRIKLLAKEHRDFPRFNAPQTFLNSISQNVPAILLAFFFSPAVVGLYWFAHRVLVAPNTLIGNSIRQVFYQRANEMVHQGENVLKLFLKSTGGLALVGIIPFLSLLFFGPILFDFIFGSDWYEAGVYTQWLSLWWFTLFINPPSIMMIPIINKQKFQLQIGVFSLLFRTSSIVIGGLLSSSIIAIALFSIVGAINNIIIIVYIYINIKD